MSEAGVGSTARSPRGAEPKETMMKTMTNEREQRRIHLDDYRQILEYLNEAERLLTKHSVTGDLLGDVLEYVRHTIKYDRKDVGHLEALRTEPTP